MKINKEMSDNKIDVWECKCGTYTPVKKGSLKPKCEYCRRVKEKKMTESTLEHYFNLCKKGKAGVMPYWEGKKNITFVGYDKEGRGREVKLGLTKEGVDEASKLYKELKDAWKKKEKKK